MNTHLSNSRFLILVLLLITTIFSFSCSQGVPEIRSTVVQLVRVQSPSLSFDERLSVFVFFEDSDGSADYKSITVTHSDSSLTWTILPSDASVRLRGVDRWTGSANLAGPGGGQIPGGNYTLAVTDLAGNEAISTFSVVRPVFPEGDFFRFSIEGEKWILERSTTVSSFSRTFLLLYDTDAKLLYSYRIGENTQGRLEGTIASLRSMANETVSVRCYTENDTGTAGVLLIPANLQ